MKLIKQESFLKIVNFHGAELEVPEETRWLAASKNGTVNAFAICKPDCIRMHNGGWWEGHDDCLIGGGVNSLGEVAVVDLEGMDWTQSCLCVE